MSVVPRPALRAARLKRKAETEEVGHDLPTPKAKAKAKGKVKSAKKWLTLSILEILKWLVTEVVLTISQIHGVAILTVGIA